MPRRWALPVKCPEVSELSTSLDPPLSSEWQLYCPIRRPLEQSLRSKRRALGSVQCKELWALITKGPPPGHLWSWPFGTLKQDLLSHATCLTVTQDMFSLLSPFTVWRCQQFWDVKLVDRLPSIPQIGNPKQKIRVRHAPLQPSVFTTCLEYH